MTVDVPTCVDCGTTDDLSFEPDPYCFELYDDDTPEWRCEGCLQARALEV
jgi:hypothetical protein